MAYQLGFSISLATILGSYFNKGWAIFFFIDAVTFETAVLARQTFGSISINCCKAYRGKKYSEKTCYNKRNFFKK